MSTVKTIGISCRDEEAEKKIRELKKEANKLAIKHYEVEPYALIEGWKKAIAEKKEWRKKRGL